MGYSGFPYQLPRLRSGEDTPASPHGVGTTRGMTVTGYKPSHLFGVKCGARGHSRQWERPSCLIG
jgi:hypothetical protein